MTVPDISPLIAAAWPLANSEKQLTALTMKTKFSAIFEALCFMFHFLFPR